MTTSEEAIYLRARGLWLDAGARRRADPLRPSFGANVSAVQFGLARLAWYIREFWRALW
jgi:hypothetical protein